MPALQVCLLGGHAGSVLPHSRTYRRKHYVLATYSHLQWPRIICLEKSGWTIRISKRLTFTWNVLVYVCVCVRVFSVYLIIVFSTFHPWLLPLPSLLSRSDRYSTKTAYLWCILSRLCLQVLDWRRRGEMEGAEREEARKGGTKKHMREREGVATPLLLSEWSVETGLKCGGVTTDWMLIACKDRKRTDMLKWCSWKEHRRTGGSRKKKTSSPQESFMPQWIIRLI